MNPPPHQTGALLSRLHALRADVLEQLEGLDEEQLHRAVGGTPWNALGVVQHLAVACERFWFRGVVAGEADVIADFGRAPVTYWVPSDVPASQVLERYAAEAALSDLIIGQRRPDQPPAWWPEAWTEPRPSDLAEVVVQVVLETATHAGQLSGLRSILLTNDPAGCRSV